MSEDREGYKTETPMGQSDLEQCVMRAVNCYEIDFNKVKSLDDIKNIIAQLEITFSDTAGVNWKERPIGYLLKVKTA